MARRKRRLTKKKVKRRLNTKAATALPFIPEFADGFDTGVFKSSMAYVNLFLQKAQAARKERSYVLDEYLKAFGVPAPKGMRWELVKARIITHYQYTGYKLHGKVESLKKSFLQNYRAAWSSAAEENKVHEFDPGVRGLLNFNYETEENKMATKKKAVKRTLTVNDVATGAKAVTKKKAPVKKAATKKTAPAKRAAPAKAKAPKERDPRLPKNGTVLTGTHKGKEIKVKVTADGFVAGTETFKSLSAAAKSITKCAVNGFLFFGLNK